MLRPIHPPITTEDRITLPVNDAVRISGLSRFSIYNMINDGRLRSTKVCGPRLILRESLQEILTGGER